MNSTNGNIELEVDSDACGSGSKLSDDSGIEDSWNDESSNLPPMLKSQGHKGEENGDKVNPAIASEVPFKSFTPLTPPDDHYLPAYGPMNIYPSGSAQPNSLVVRSDVEDPCAVAGVCGIENLGNTCFMNAGLQCIFATASLKQLIYNEKCLGLVTNQENSQAVIRLVDRFQELFQKVLGGKFKYLYPVDFHTALTQVHAIFGDRKQHDCQEFISFLLNGLHDALNRINPRKRHQSNQDSSRESSPRLSSLKLETSSESENDELEEIRKEVPKRMKMDSVEQEPDFGVECDERLTEAQVAWRGYLQQNRSVIVDTFQGQFKSMVTCEKCHHVSVTYEPFMHVSVPIPYANEKQVIVHWRFKATKGSCKSVEMQTRRYVISVSKNACVGDVKRELIKTLEKDDKEIKGDDIVMAEVSNSSLARTLVPEMNLQFLKWKENKKLYAIECQKFETSRDADESPMLADELEEDDGNDQSVLPREGPMGWHTCGICLEDIFDDDLMIHNVCGGILCKDCLEVNASYHAGQSFPCPVCNATVDEKIFCEMNKSPKRNLRNREILVPVLTRYVMGKEERLQETGGLKDKQFCTFGHPSVLLLPAEMRIPDIRAEVSSLLPRKEGLEYSILLTDWQGISCSRCDTFSDCPGCILQGEDHVVFRPGDHITVQFEDTSQPFIDEVSDVKSDVSCASLREDDVLELSECFKSFAESEMLSEENPWFCPKCRRNQVATKGISISKWPDVLIVHLKRFYFEGLHSAKVTTPISFPLDQFNLDFVCSAEVSSKEHCVYDLIGLVCHTGGLSCGHYTAYVKNNSTWYLFNDEVTSKVDPSTIDLERAYMFFYQRSCNG